jgi:hypothetical protein
VLLLFVTHAVDIWLASRAAAAAEGMSTLSGFLDPAAWLQPSVFMALPLVVYAVFVGPLLVRRTLAARGTGPESGDDGGTGDRVRLVGISPASGITSTLALVGAIEVVAVVYLLLAVL